MHCFTVIAWKLHRNTLLKSVRDVWRHMGVNGSVGERMEVYGMVRKAYGTGLVFTKGLRLKSSLKVKTFVSTKFCLKTVFTKGDLAKSKMIK